MILFFDTETTGLPDFKRPISDDSQPHIIQLGAILAEDDGTERACVNVVSYPGIPIPKAASDVHGITDDIALRGGIFPATLTRLFVDLLASADLLVAHNLKFDLFLAELLKNSRVINQVYRNLLICDLTQFFRSNKK